MAQHKYIILVPKKILEGGDTTCFEFEVFAKDLTQAIKRARVKAVESGEFLEPSIQDDWRWKRLKVK